MQIAERDALKERHRFREWAGKSTTTSDRGVRKLAFTGEELPGFRLDRTERREDVQPPRLTTFWRRAATQAVVRVDVFECASVNAAHEYLIDALNEFESAGIGRRTDARVWRCHVRHRFGRAVRSREPGRARAQGHTTKRPGRTRRADD